MSTTRAKPVHLKNWEKIALGNWITANKAAIEAGKVNPNEIAHPDFPNANAGHFRRMCADLGVTIPGKHNPADTIAKTAALLVKQCRAADVDPVEAIKNAMG